MEAIYLQKLKEEIKQKIIEVGKLKFKKEGYENTSMKDIASDVGISTGNIYRYFLTKKHLLAEILKEIENEIEEFFEKIPSDYDDSSSYQLFDSLIEFTLRLAEDKGDTLKVMFNSEKESQFIEFREKILEMFINKIKSIAISINSKKNIDSILCEAISRAQFEGFIYIVKNNIDDIELLKRNLEMYEELMLKGLKNKVVEVIEK